jgi:hypothetical protein
MSIPPRASTAASTNARLVRDVERQGDVGLDLLDPPRAADDPDARVAQLPDGRGADPRRRAGDDRRLAAETHELSLNAVETWQRGNAEAIVCGPAREVAKRQCGGEGDAFRGCPAESGDQAAGIRFRGFPLAS